MANNKAVSKANLELALTENNKKVKEYVDTGNEVLTGKVDEIKKYQKFVNTDLDYLHISSKSLSESTTIGQAIEANKNILPLFADKIGNMITDEESYVLLSKGKKYYVHAALLVYNSTGHFYIVNKNGDILSNRAYMLVVNHNIAESIQPTVSVILEPTEDMYIGLCTSSAINIYMQFGYFTVQEIGQKTIIDPVEHANEKYGIEDTPVGHIISHMGTVAPKHYLICDGTEYNIMDYPYLAQHFIDQFGSVNYFGGDGSTTFAVPDLRQRFLKGVVETENVGVNEEAGLPNITGSLSAAGAVAWKGGSGVFSLSGNQISVATQNTSSTSQNVLSFNASHSNAIYGSSTTVTPKNTAVLYCIKYEPTYYIQNYATKFQETTLWEGIHTISFGTAGYSSSSVMLSLADSIRNYDKVEIKCRTRNTTTGLNGMVWSEIITTDDITDFNEHCDRTITLANTTGNNCIYTRFDDETTYNIAGFYVVATDTSYTFEIYKIVGLKPAKPVYDVAINCDNDYSTEERVIGRWVDGKPLYQKTIISTMPQVETDGTFVDMQLNDSTSFDDVISLTGFFVNDDKSTVCPINADCASNSYSIASCFAGVGNGKLLMRSNMTAWNDRTAYLTVQYTKTTDSAETTTRKSYSLDETLTGDTWIDGKPIYRRVISAVLPDTVGSVQLGTLENYETIIKTDGKIMYNDGTAASNIDYYFASDHYATCYIKENRVVMKFVASVHCNCPVHVIIEYTKSE